MAAADGTRRRPLPAHLLLQAGAWLRDDARVRLGAAEMTLALVCGGVFLWPLLVHGPYEEEIVQATIFPNQVFYRELFRGRWLFWLNDLGFGTPFPLGDPFLFHPVFAPLAGMGATLRVTLSALWIAQVVVMVVYFMRVMALTGIRAPLRLLLLACYLGSATTTTYFYDNDWVQMVITWSLYPVLVYYLHQAGREQGRFWFASIRLALLFAFWILNAHPGYLVPLVAVLAVYVLVATPPNRTAYATLAVGALLCSVAVLPRVYFIVSEMGLFGPQADMERDTSSLMRYAMALTFDPTQRAPFLGLGLMAAVIASLWRFPHLGHAHLRACTAAFVVAVACNVLPREVLSGVGGWLFRDGMIFFGLLAGGQMLQRGLAGRAFWQAAAVLLVALQVVHQVDVIVRPSVTELVDHNRLQFYRYQGQEVGLGKVLADLGRTHGRRLYLSPVAEGLMRGRLSDDGVHFSSDLVFLGLNPVNGWFKNVSMETLMPAEKIMEGTISGDLRVIENAALLDVLGIDVVVTTEQEGPPPQGLTVVERFTPARDLGTNLLLLANDDAWPKAVLLRPEAASTTLPVVPECRHDRALCRDYEPLKRMRLPGTVTLDEEDGRYVARVPPANDERLLFLSVYYRPHWQATAGDDTLQVQPVANAFVSVVVPPGVGEVTLQYVPRTFMRLTALGTISFFALLTACCALSVRSHKTASLPAASRRAVDQGSIA